MQIFSQENLFYVLCPRCITAAFKINYTKHVYVNKVQNRAVLISIITANPIKKLLSFIPISTLVMDIDRIWGTNFYPATQRRYILTIIITLINLSMK